MIKSKGLVNKIRTQIIICYHHYITTSSKNISTHNSYLRFRCSHKLLQSQKQVSIERLAATVPLTILQNSRHRHIQRFLALLNTGMNSIFRNSYKPA